MELTTRRYLRRVLTIHLALLALVAAGVLMVAREVYEHSRQQAIDQARVRHELIARQTSRAIEGHYSAILADLQVLRQFRADERLADGFKGQWVLAPVLWNHMGQRVSHLLRVDPVTLEVVAAFPHGAASEIKAQLVVSDPWAREWLRGLRRGDSAVSGYRSDGAGGYTLVAVGVDDDTLLVAVVPFGAVQRLFLDDVNEEGTSVAASLLENSLPSVAVGAYPKSLAFVDQIPDPTVRELADEYVRGGKRGTVIVRVPEAGYRGRYGEVVTAGSPIAPGARERLRERLFTVEPVVLPGKQSAVLVSSWLDDVNSIASATFLRAAVGTVLVLLIVTGILISTSVQLIRGRLRMERMRHQMITKELNQARQIQLAWLPSADSGCLHACDIAAANRPASHVSGDFYDWFELDHCRVAVTIGDVTGHGMAAAFLMATTQLLVRTTLRRVQDPARCLDEVNKQLCGAAFGGQFVTMLVAVIDTDRNELQIATAGHYPPMLSERESHGPTGGLGARSLTMESGLVLGIEPEAAFNTGRFPLQQGSGLLFYTDGVIEARSPGGDYFTTAGIRRALEALRPDPEAKAQGMVDAVVAAVEQFRADRELLDDLTLVAVQLQPGNRPGADHTSARTEPLVVAV